MNVRNTFISYLLTAIISLVVFIYFDRTDISLNKLKEYLPSNSISYPVNATDEPYTYLIDYNTAEETGSFFSSSSSGVGVLDGGGTFGQGFEFILKDSYPDSLKRISISAKIKKTENAPFEFVIVISIENPSGENVFWDAVYTNDFDFPPGEWKKLNGEKVIPSASYDPGYKVKVYPWNKGKAGIEIDDFSVVLGAQKERRGNQVLTDLIENNNYSADHFIKYNTINATRLFSADYPFEQLSDNCIYTSGSSVQFYNFSSHTLHSLNQNKSTNTLNLPDQLLPSPYTILSRNVDETPAFLSFNKTNKVIEMHEGLPPFRKTNTYNSNIDYSANDSLLQQFVITNAQGIKTHLLLFASGTIYHAALTSGSSGTYKKTLLPEICKGSRPILIPVINTVNQHIEGFITPTDDSEVCYHLTVNSSDFSVKRIKVNDGLEFTIQSALYKTATNDYLLFNNSWRFDLRRIAFTNNTCSALEKIELTNDAGELSPKFYEQQIIFISQSPDRGISITLACKNNSNRTQNKDLFKSKVEQYQLKL